VTHVAVLVRNHARDPLEAVRAVIVSGCAIALIAAGQVLPF
jgi:hypothetical protein